MRAREPDAEGFVERDGVKVAFEVFGDGEPAVLLMPTFPIVHSRMWKAQVPYLARHYRVITIDPRGNGRSDRPQSPEAYGDAEFVADTLAVMDATATGAAVLVGLCLGVRWSVEVANAAPERVLGIVALAPGMPHLSPPHPWRSKAVAMFDEEVPESEGWAAKENRRFWLTRYRDWVEAHSGPEFMTPEPHSTRIRDELVAWGLETTPEVLLAATDDRTGAPPYPPDKAAAEAMVRAVRCPILMIAGTLDRCQPLSRAERMAELCGGRLEVIEGAGHTLFARYPVRVNLLISDFVEEVAGRSRSHAPAGAVG